MSQTISSVFTTRPETQQCNAAIANWQDLTTDLAIFQVVPDEGPVSDYDSGQFATLGLPRDSEPIDDPNAFPEGDPRWKKLIRRAYSIASSPLQRHHLEFYVARVAAGKLTPKIWNLKNGGRIWLDPRIKGEFTLHGVPDGKDLVMVSTGTGLAPFISMYKTYRNTDRWRRFIVIHGARHKEDLGYRRDFERFAVEDPSFIYVPAVTREPAGSTWTGHRGRVSTILLDDAVYHRYTGSPLDADQCHVFLCGNPDMINDVEGSLVARGFITHNKKQSGNLHFERYW